VRPRLAVVSGRADLDPSASLFADRDPDDPPPLVYTSTDVPPDRLVGLYGVAEVVATDGAPDVAAVWPTCTTGGWGSCCARADRASSPNSPPPAWSTNSA